jgi:class I fructose-bisphosphate aldolase
MFNTGRLAGTGYLSILPVDQGTEHSAGASFAKNPDYFDGGNIVKLAIEGGCNAVASTFGVLGSVARKYAHKIPFLVKINHNELLTFPNKADEILFGSVKQGYEMGAVAVGATIYFGSDHSDRQIIEISRAFKPKLTNSAWLTVLWCYLRNSAFKKTRTITSRPTSLARPTTLASPSKPISSSRLPKITVATLLQHGRFQLRKIR